MIRVLQTELVQIIGAIGRHRAVIGVKTIKVGDISVEIGQQLIAVAKVAIQVDLGKEQGEPLIIFPHHRALAFGVDGLGVAHNIFFIAQQLCLAQRWWLIGPEKLAGDQGVIEMVQVVVIQPFQPRILDGRDQEMKRAHGFALPIMLAQGVNTKERDEPLIEQQLVAKVVRLGTTGAFFVHHAAIPRPTCAA
jgi:hypothetical protein